MSLLAKPRSLITFVNSMKKLFVVLALFSSVAWGQERVVVIRGGTVIDGLGGVRKKAR